MILITGDIHGQCKRLNNIFKKIKQTDVIIQLGDLGLIWTKENKIQLDYIQKKHPNKELLWIDGNHQNFARLYSDYQVIQRYGSPVHKIRNNIYHLMRGYIYTIQQKTFFCFGGGISIDKQWRTPYISWWPQQMPNSFEYETGLDSLQKVNYNVDYILTHSAPHSLYKNLENVIKNFHKLQIQDSLSKYLDVVMQNCTFRKWFIGHYHIDSFIIRKKYCFLYEGEIFL